MALTRLGSHGVPLGVGGDFTGKEEAAPAPATGVQGIYAPITRLHAHRREIFGKSVKDFIYASLVYNGWKPAYQED